MYQLLPIRCYTCSTVLARRSVIQYIDRMKADKAVYSMQEILTHIKTVENVPINYCCNVRYMNYINGG